MWAGIWWDLGSCSKQEQIKIGELKSKTAP